MKAGPSVAVRVAMPPRSRGRPQRMWPPKRAAMYRTPDGRSTAAPQAPVGVADQVVQLGIVGVCCGVVAMK